MVIEDLSDLDKKNKLSSELAPHEILAPSADRLIANFLDVLLHFPLFNLFVSLFLHKLRLLKWVTESSTESFYVYLQCSIVIFVAILIFQSIYYKILNYTPGMYLMKLRLRSYNANEISWGQAFLRSFFWIMGALSFGLPFLEVFSHKHRKLIHDRVSETEVYSLKKSYPEAGPLAIETSMVRAFFILIAMAFLGWLNAFINLSQNEIESGRLAISEFTERGMLCEEVDEVSKRTHVDITKSEMRLEFAAALFMLGQMDEACLNKELDFAYLKKQNNTNQYFIKALISAAYSEDRKKYLSLACGEDKKWCDLTFLLENTETANLKDIVAKVENTWKLSSWTYKIAALKLFNRLGQSELALNVISSLQDDGIQSTGLIEQQLRALQRLERAQDVKEVLRGVRSVVIEKDFARLNSELCLQSLDSSCVEADLACKNFIGLVAEHKDLLVETGPSRAVFKYHSCRKQLNENMEYWSLIENEDIQEIVQWALYLQQPDLRANALAKLRVFVEDKAKPQSLRFDSLQILLQNTNYDKDWQLAINFWHEFSPYNDAYLSASNWLIKEAKTQKKETQLAVLDGILKQNPGLNLDTDSSLKEAKAIRLPAEVPQQVEKK